jgi:hypothetical protein
MAESTEVQPTQIVTSEAPVSHISGAEVAQPYELLARSLDKAGMAFDKIAEPLAEHAGSQAVARNPDGSLSVTHVPIFGPAGDAYARALKFSALAEADGAAKRTDIALREQYRDNPEGYQQAANAYKEKTVKDISTVAGPEVGVAVGKAIDTTTTYTYRELSNEAHHKIVSDFDKTTRAQLESKTQDLTDLVATGGAGTKAAKDLAGEIHSILNERVNGVTREPQQVADLALTDLHRKIYAAGKEYEVNQTLKSQSPYQGAIDISASQYNLNPVLFARQLHQESGLNPNVAPSAAGAQGIAQFMPATAKRYGVDVRDPASSIAGAAHYMSDLTRMFGGNTGLALAGYNWGEGKVAAWLASGANPAAMPAETRNYVQAITGQSIEAWTAGQRPSAQAISALGVPPAAAGGVQRALTQTQGYLEDQSVPPSQRLANYNAGIKAIKEYHENNIRLANISEVNQKKLDEDFENTVALDAASENPQITETQVKSWPGTSFEAKQRMVKFLRQEDMPEPIARVSQRNQMELFSRINLPAGDPQKITSAAPIRDVYSNGGLTWTAEQQLEKSFADARTPEGDKLSQIRGQFEKGMQASITKSNPMMGKLDESGDQQMYLFQRYVDQKVDEQRKAGKSPFDLFDPANPAYLGAPQVLQQFQKPIEQSMKDIADKLTRGMPGAAPTAAPGAPAPLPPPPTAVPATPPLQQRKAGETPIDYLKRIGGTVPAMTAPAETPAATPQIIMPAPPMRM